MNEPRVLSVRSEVEEQGEVEEAFLIAAARGGDEIAFGRLVERYKEVVFAAAAAITRDLDAAHDIAQETFLRAWFGLAGLQEASSLAGWLRTIARNRAKTWLERRKRHPVQENAEADQIVDSADSPERNAEKSERRRLVMDALDRLPEGSREALMLHYMEDLPTPQIAAHLGITQEAVRQRLRRARQQMQREVEDMVADVIKEEAPGADFTESVSALLERSRGLFEQVQYRLAAPVLETAREQAPTNTLVSMLLADAYTFTRGAEELEADRGSYTRALALLDEVVEREPDNLLAQLRRAAVRSTLAPPEEVIGEQKRIMKAARGGPYEAVAELELARRYLTRGEAGQALPIYKRLGKKHDWLACVLASEMGVAHAMSEDGSKAMRSFELAVELTTPEAMGVLRETSHRLIGEAYWGFWSTVDNLSVRQCQNHAWLAGLRSVSGNMDRAREHVREAVRFLNMDEVGAARATLKKEFARQMEQMFPQLAEEAEVRQLWEGENDSTLTDDD